MSQKPCPVHGCDRPRPGHRHICGACEAALDRDLQSIPDLAAELDTTLARQGVSGGGGVRSTEVPLPYDARATEALDILHSTLLGWEHALLTGLTRPAGPRCAACRHWSCGLIAFTTAPDGTVPGLARWLHHRLHRLLRHSAVAQAVDEIAAATRCARRTIDRPPGSTFAGACPHCAAPLYTRRGTRIARCRACGAQADVADQQQQLLDQIGDQLLHSVALSAVLTGLGVRVPASTIRYWASEDEDKGRARRLFAHSRDANGRPLYRVSEVLDLYLDRVQRTADTRPGG